MKLLTTSFILFASLFFTGCAKRYHAISPETINYSSIISEEGVDLGYRYGILRERGNKKMAKKEDNRGVKIVAVKIKNNTDEDMVLGSNYHFYTGNTLLSLLSPELIQSTVKQNTLSYLPYLLLTFLTLNVETNDSKSSYPIGLIVGPGITVGNMLVAGGSNSKFINELRQYNLSNQVIKPGETKCGIIGIDRTGYDPIVLKKSK